MELERAFKKIALAKGLLHSKHSTALRGSNEEVDELKELVAEARIQSRKLKTLIKQARTTAAASK